MRHATIIYVTGRAEQTSATCLCGWAWRPDPGIDLNAAIREAGAAASRHTTAADAPRDDG
jgi:hypothetical protein